VTAALLSASEPEFFRDASGKHHLDGLLLQAMTLKTRALDWPLSAFL
jgi:hypothetical protein